MALSVSDLRFGYGQATVLDGISFDVQKGETVAILGKNGAGKSTLLGLLTGLLSLQFGQIKLIGQKGVVFQDNSLDIKLTAQQNLQLYGQLYGIEANELSRRIQLALSQTELAERARHKVKTFSGGMKRKLDLARALLHAPQLLLLDEPTAGLDALAFAQFWELLSVERKNRSMAIVMATHRFEEAELCDRVLVLHKGKLVAQGTPDELKRIVSGDRVVIKLSSGEEIQSTVDDGPSQIPRLVESRPRGSIESIFVRKPTLADAFLKITGEA